MAYGPVWTQPKMWARGGPCNNPNPEPEAVEPEPEPEPEPPVVKKAPARRVKRTPTSGK